ncbi:hypothetical protein C8F04DRAFT_1177135 [Mycena alexandri]|uniref:Uncharacterized protein n=1 Tax=Mycena alexandri TaxID=1745969 RepID=A0AAD6TA67_9AGAR|nr:hypothetical protein C8F04DRAFT_1177135 [Mycena alexandri]
MSTTGADLTSAISECESLVNRAYSVFYALFALVGAVVVALCVGRPPRTTSIKRLRHWIRTSSSFFFTTTTTWLFLLTTTTMNPSHILVAISECTPLVNPSQLVLCTVALTVGAVVVTIRFGRPPRTTSLKRLRRWIRICELRIIARRTYNRLPPTLAEIRALRPLFRVATIAEFPDSYANDGYGATYFNAVVANETLGAYYEGLITAAEFLVEVRVKVGETVNLPNRQQGYNGCNFRQTHFWLCCFYQKKRKAAEKMSHSLFLDDAPRARLPCSCQPGKVHAEYWWLRDLGSFSEVGGRIHDVLALLGQPDLVRHDLRDAWLMSLVASDKRIRTAFLMKDDLGGAESMGLGRRYVGKVYSAGVPAGVPGGPPWGAPGGLAERRPFSGPFTILRKALFQPSRKRCRKKTFQPAFRPS